ncbi:MAG: LysR family transcriptional regulator [Pseudomonadota bacterium]|nr:LysR family transcriptional regulator [Pseudomonadota bacterium]
MNITFRQLRVFVEVARQGSMARAAATLHLTPPAVSMQVKEIETQVGLQLFDRNGRSVRLSTAGEYFVVHARRMLADLREAENAMARFSGLEQGLLTIGMLSTAKYFVPRLLARFNADHPGIEVRLRVVGNREQLVQEMHAGEIDLSVMGRPPRELETRAESFAAHPLVFIAPPEHPLLAFASVQAEQLQNFPFIVREPGSGTRTTLEAFFAEQRVVPRVSMEMSSNETIKQAVMAGLGLSFLSLHTVGLELRSQLLALLPVAGTPVMRTWYAVHLQSKVQSPAAEAFRAFLLAHGEAYLESHDRVLLAR